MAASPAFAATPRIGAAAVSTANTARDGTGTIATVFSAGSGGSQIREVDIKGTATTVASSVVLFVHDGTNFWVLSEIPVSAVTASATVASFSASSLFTSLFLPSGWSLRASITAAPTSGVVNVIALGADL